jgi:hypothetical protein
VKLKTASERARLWVDNILAIDQWNSLGVGSPTAQFDATSVGTTRLIPLELHFQHQSGDALVELWSEVILDQHYRDIFLRLGAQKFSDFHAFCLR